MSNIPLEQTTRQLKSYGFFDIGKVVTVVKKPISTFTDETTISFRSTRPIG